jgi:hypothetical protein
VFVTAACGEEETQKEVIRKVTREVIVVRPVEQKKEANDVGRPRQETLPEEAKAKLQQKGEEALKQQP